VPAKLYSEVQHEYCVLLLAHVMMHNALAIFLPVHIKRTPILY